MQITGITVDGKITVNGLSRFYFQYGLPFTFMFDILIKNNLVPFWQDLFRELQENGMSDNRIRHLLNEHIFESYGKEYRDVVLSRL